MVREESGLSSTTRWFLLETNLSVFSQVYDVSTFLQEHPGGAAILEENSGVYFPCELDLVEILYITYHILSMEDLLCED